MDWWERVIQNGIIGAISIFGIKEGIPLLKYIIVECIMHSRGEDHSFLNMQNDILHKLDLLIEQDIKNLSVISNNHNEIYRLLLEKNYKNEDILNIMNKIEMTLQQISLDLRLQQELFRKHSESTDEGEIAP